MEGRVACRFDLCLKCVCVLCVWLLFTERVRARDPLQSTSCKSSLTMRPSWSKCFQSAGERMSNACFVLFKFLFARCSSAQTVVGVVRCATKAYHSE